MVQQLLSQYCHIQTHYSPNQCYEVSYPWEKLWNYFSIARFIPHWKGFGESRGAKVRKQRSTKQKEWNFQWDFQLEIESGLLLGLKWDNPITQWTETLQSRWSCYGVPMNSDNSLVVSYSTRPDSLYGLATVCQRTAILSRDLFMRVELPPWRKTRVHEQRSTNK